MAKINPNEKIIHNDITRLHDFIKLNKGDADSLDHIKPFVKYTELRTVLSNGITYVLIAITKLTLGE